MFNTTQPQSIPYLSRLGTYQKDKEKAANDSLLPINQPGGNTDTQLPVVKEKEDPMKGIEQTSFYQNHQRFMQNDPEYAAQFNEFAATAAALHKEVKNGTMPQPIAEKRLQEAVYNAQQTAVQNARQAQMQQQQLAKQQVQGALLTPINQMKLGAGDVPSSSAEDAAAMAAQQGQSQAPVEQAGQQPAAPQPSPQQVAQMQQQEQDAQQQASNTQQVQSNTLSKGSIEDLADVMRQSGLIQEGDDAQTIASMYYNTKGYTNEDVDKAAAMLFGDQHAAQAAEPPKGVAPQYVVSDSQINAVAARNANISQGIGDFRGNVEAPEMPTPSQQLNQSLDQASNAVQTQVNEIPNWYESKPFGYSLMRFGIGLLAGEDMVNAFQGASQSYMDLDGMEKRERWRSDLKKEGYSDAQIEAYVQTGNSNLLKKERDVWGNTGQGTLYNQRTGDFKEIPGWQRKPNLRYFQDANNEWIGYDPVTNEQVRTGVVGRAPSNLTAPRFQWVGVEGDPTKEHLKQYDASTGGWIDTGEMRNKGSTALSEGERVRQSIANAADDQYYSEKGAGVVNDTTRNRIGQFQETYRRSANHIQNVIAGRVKPIQLGSISGNVIQAIVDDPESFLKSALFNSLTKEQQEGMYNLYQIIDPVARARSGAAISKPEMQKYLRYADKLHLQNEEGARARIGFLSTMSGMIAGTRKDMNVLQNDVLPTARDARINPETGLWEVGYMKNGKPAKFVFKPGRF